jgi:hypothetical protein
MDAPSSLRTENTMSLMSLCMIAAPFLLDEIFD